MRCISFINISVVGILFFSLNVLLTTCAVNDYHVPLHQEIHATIPVIHPQYTPLPDVTRLCQMLTTAQLQMLLVWSQSLRNQRTLTIEQRRHWQQTSQQLLRQLSSQPRTLLIKTLPDLQQTPDEYIQIVRAFINNRQPGLPPIPV